MSVEGGPAHDSSILLPPAEVAVASCKQSVLEAEPATRCPGSSPKIESQLHSEPPKLDGKSKEERGECWKQHLKASQAKPQKKSQQQKKKTCAGMGDQSDELVQTLQENRSLDHANLSHTSNLSSCGSLVAAAALEDIPVAWMEKSFAKLSRIAQRHSIYSSSALPNSCAPCGSLATHQLPAEVASTSTSTAQVAMPMQIVKGNQCAGDAGRVLFSSPLSCRRLLVDEQRRDGKKFTGNSNGTPWSWGKSAHILTLPVEIQEKQELWEGAFLFAVLPQPGTYAFNDQEGGPINFCTSDSLPDHGQHSLCHQFIPFGTILGIQDLDNGQVRPPVDGIFDHEAFGHGYVTIRIDLSKSYKRTDVNYQRVRGWIEVDEEKRQICLVPGLQSVDFNLLQLFNEDCAELLECCSLFVTHLRDVSYKKFIMMSPDFADIPDSFPERQASQDGLARWSVAPPLSRRNEKTQQMAQMSENELYGEFEAMKRVLSAKSCSWVYESQHQTF
jgi:hypothetical protein